MKRWAPNWLIKALWKDRFKFIFYIYKKYSDYFIGLIINWMSLFLNTPIIKTAKAADSDRSTLSRSFCADTIKSVSLHEDHEYKVSAFSEFPPVSHTNSRIISIKNKQSTRLNRKRVVREVLGKMVLRKFLNNKRFFQVLAGLPEKERAKEYKVGNNLVQKTKINLETSFLRSLLIGK